LIADPSAWTPQGQIAHITDRLYWKKRQRRDVDKRREGEAREMKGERGVRP